MLVTSQPFWRTKLAAMARYRVLLRAGLVERPQVVFQDRTVEAGRDFLRAGDRIVRITDQPGLRPRGGAFPRGTRTCPK
jgi:defect-in-organelle-trafficking protein DotC